MSNHTSEIPVLILAGGQGIYIDDSGQRTAKGNVKIGTHSLLFFVIKSYLKSGFQNFIISGSYQLAQTVQILTQELNLQKTDEHNFFKGKLNEFNFSLRLLDSGQSSATGERILHAQAYLKKYPVFAVTYSDTISDMNLKEVLDFHFEHKKVATLTAARLPTRFRILGLRQGESEVRGFGKAFLHGHYVNGGFYFFNENIWSQDYLTGQNVKILETEVLDRLTEKKQLNAFLYDHEWQHLDSERDIRLIKKICDSL